MDQFLAIALSMPTVVFSVLLILMLIYWLSVIVGALEIDLFGAHGPGDGVADGLAHAGHGHGLFSALAGWLNLRRAPVTVVSSALVIYGWIFSYFGMLWLPRWFGGVSGLVWSVSVSVGACVVSLLLTSLTIRPLGPMFEVHTRRAQETMVGKEVVVKTLTVGASHGQASFDDGGAGLLLKVRCLRENGLTRGARALVIDYNEREHVYLVEPMDELLGSAPDLEVARLEQELSQPHEVEQER
jgi:hypothetical protein